MKNTLTDFGKAVRKRQIDMNISQVELADMVRKETGKYMSTQYLQNILSGTRNCPAAVHALKKILHIGMDDSVGSTVVDMNILSGAYTKVTVMEADTGKEIAVITNELITTAGQGIVVKLTPKYD